MYFYEGSGPLKSKRGRVGVLQNHCEGVTGGNVVLKGAKFAT